MEEIILYNCLIHERLFDKFFRIFCFIKNFKILNIGMNKIKNTGFENLIGTLINTHRTNLSELHAENCGISSTRKTTFQYVFSPHANVYRL